MKETAGDDESKRAKKEEAERSKSDLSAQWEQARWTYWMWVVGMVQLVVSAVTLGLLWGTFREARKTTQAAVDSARTAERALTELERPFVYAVVTQPGIAWGLSFDEERQLRFSDLELSIFNYGRTPANLTRLAYRIRTAPRGDIARPMDPRTFGGRGLPVGTVVVNEKPFSEEEPLHFRFNHDETRRLEDGTRSVWIVGFVRYDDAFGNSYITGFTEVFDRIGSRFVRKGDHQYNYARKEKRADIPPEADNHDDRMDLPPADETDPQPTPSS